MRCLFLLGAHRSGTTWLHQLMANSPAIAYISYRDIRQSLHHGSEPLRNQQILQELLSNGDDRGFDSVSVGVDLPEEYGFLLEKGGFAYYATRPISNTNFEPLEALIARKRKEHPDLPYVVLKNPVDFYDGALHIMKSFPESTLVCLHRHPWAVFRSQVKTWRTLTDRCNPYLASLDSSYRKVMADPLKRTTLQFALRQRRGLETLLQALIEGCDFHVSQRAALDSACVRLRYEDLCSNTAAELARLSSMLGLSELSQTEDRLRPQTRQLPEDSLATEVFTAHTERFRPYCDWLGYTLDPAITP